MNLATLTCCGYCQILNIGFSHYSMKSFFQHPFNCHKRKDLLDKNFLIKSMPCLLPVTNISKYVAKCEAKAQLFYVVQKLAHKGNNTTSRFTIWSSIPAELIVHDMLRKHNTSYLTCITDPSQPITHKKKWMHQMKYNKTRSLQTVQWWRSH